jgi:CBS domain-containing protein
MKVKDILAKKDGSPITVSGDETIHDGMKLLADNKIGSLVVVDNNGAPVGIITERDIFRLTYEVTGDIRSRKIADHMTSDLIIGVPEDDVDYIARVITQNRIRHIPIIDNNKQLCGLVSIGDIVKARLDIAEVHIRYLTEFISGRSKTESEHRNNKSV